MGTISLLKPPQGYHVEESKKFANKYVRELTVFRNPKYYELFVSSQKVLIHSVRLFHQAERSLACRLIEAEKVRSYSNRDDSDFKSRYLERLGNTTPSKDDYLKAVRQHVLSRAMGSSFGQKEGAIV